MATIMNASAVRCTGVSQKQQGTNVSARAHMVGRPVVAKALRKADSVVVSSKTAQVMKASRRERVATRAIKTVASVATETEQG